MDSLGLLAGALLSISMAGGVVGYIFGRSDGYVKGREEGFRAGRSFHRERVR